MSEVMLDTVIPGGVGLLLCLGAAAWFGRLGFRAVNAQRWPEVPGHIVFSQAVPGRRGSARAQIRYRYRVGLQEFTGDTVFFGDGIEANAAMVHERVNAWPVGRPLTVRHHPTRPQVCCLEPRADLRVWLFFGGALVMAGLILKALAQGE